MKHAAELSTRDKIMRMLKTTGEMSAKEITAQLGISGMAVRRHISTLQRQSLIDSTTVRQPMGRPASVYRLTKQAEDFFPKKYNALALDLLSELEGESGEQMVNHLFDLRKASLTKTFESAMFGKDLEDRVAALSALQSDSGYMAAWEKKDDEYFLTEYNCPISQVADKYSHACTCELKLFESLLDAEVERTECLAEGGSKCLYCIRPARTEPVASREKTGQRDS